MIHFTVNNIRYSLCFYPCGFMARITEEKTGRARDFKFDKNTTFKHFIAVLERTQF